MPTSSALSFHGARSRYAVTLKSAGMRKSRSRRVANLISPRIRDTRKVRLRSESSGRSRSSPTTYQTPFSSNSPYGLTVRSASESVPIVQYRNRAVRWREIACSSLARRWATSLVYDGPSSSTVAVLGPGSATGHARPSARFCSARRSGSA